MPTRLSIRVIPCVRRGLASCFLGLGVLVALVAVAEVGANIVLDHLPLDLFKNFASASQYEKRVGRNAQFSYQGGFGIYPTPGYASGRNRHNSMGFRGGEVAVPKPQGVFRIACLGSSTTYDVNIDDWSHAWPARLQGLLQERGFAVEVVNAGGPSWTSREQILNCATRVSYVQPDLIVVYEGINDLVYRATWPPDQLRGDYTSPFVIMPEFARSPWYSSLTLFRIPLILTGRLTPPCSVDPFWCDTIKSQGAVNIFSLMRNPAWQSLTGGRKSSIPPGMTLKDVFAATPTTYFAKNMGNVIACAKNQRANILLVGLILDWQGLGRETVDRGEGLRLGISQINGVLDSVGKECCVPYYDLARDWPQNGDHWSDFVHNNDEGALVKARMIADFIVGTGLIQKPGSDSSSNGNEPL